MATAPMVQKSLSLNKTEEAILKTVTTVRYASLEEVIRSHFSQGSRNHAREVLPKLSGGGDWQATGYLYRFPLPTTRGNSPRIFCLARRGALYLRRSGVPAHWYVRGDRVRNYSYGYLLHQLTVSRLLVALQGFYREHPEYQLTELLTCYDIARKPPLTVFSVAGQDTTVVAIPDAWIYLERVADGKGVALWIEVDLATEQRRYFQDLVSARIALIKSGQYRAYFGTPVVLEWQYTLGFLCLLTFTLLRPEESGKRHTVVSLPTGDGRDRHCLLRTVCISLRLAPNFFIQGLSTSLTNLRFIDRSCSRISRGAMTTVWSHLTRWMVSLINFRMNDPKRIRLDLREAAVCNHTRMQEVVSDL